MRKKGQRSLGEKSQSHASLPIVLSNTLPNNKRELPPLNNSTTKPSKLPRPAPSTIVHRTVVL